MISAEQKTKLLDFLSRQELAVISTVAKGKPEGAVIAFVEKDDLSVIFGTFRTTRKYLNLLADPYAALTIGWSNETRITVQYEGVAHELTGNEAKIAGRALSKKNERSKKYLDLPDQRYFKITPTWIRYSNFSAVPDEIFEVSF